MADAAVAKKPEAAPEQELTDGFHLIIDALKLNGLTTIYGVPGIPITDFGRMAQAEGIRVISFRHEQNAGYAASIAGFLTKKPGVCLTVSAPGFLNGLTALAHATTNCFPMILISGSSEREIVDLQQGDYEEMDQLAIAKPLCKAAYRILHVQDIDYYTNCQTFVECLSQVRAWSEAHPLHAPLMIQVEAKDDVLPAGLGFDFVVPVPIGPAEMDAIDYEIRSVFPPAALITPDDVRGSHATLREAIEQDGWPTLAESRGKVFFCFDNENATKTFYLNGHPSLRGRIMFTSSAPPADEAGFVKLNDPLGDFARIQEYVGQGYIVRTRADADTVQARTGDTTMRDAAITSGAQFVSTDYPVPDPRFGTGYMVEIPGGMPARCNPISAPAECVAGDIE